MTRGDLQRMRESPRGTGGFRRSEGWRWRLALRGPQLVAGGVDTGVPNSVFYGGCTITDEILQLKATSRNQATFLSALGRLTNLWKSQKLITNAQRNAILAAAAKLP